MDWRLNDNDGKIYGGPMGDEICSIPSDSDEDMAHARLIVAAPELLAVLKMLWTEVTESYDADRHPDLSVDEMQRIENVLLKLEN